jgi:hypothetical protein
MKSFREDYNFGIESENKNIETLEQFFEVKYTKLSKFHKMDFECESNFIEIKSRNINKEKFDETLIPFSKIEFASKQEKDVYFIFIFTNDITYIKYDPILFKTFQIKEFKRKSRYDFNDLKQDYLYIPIKFLTSINAI